MGEHKHAKVLRAIADGQEVEYWSIEAEEWVTGGYINPITSYELKWRIKPKPPIVDFVRLSYESFIRIDYHDEPNVSLTFDPDTKRLIKVELI